MEERSSFDDEALTQCCITKKHLIRNEPLTTQVRLIWKRQMRSRRRVQHLTTIY